MSYHTVHPLIRLTIETGFSSGEREQSLTRNVVYLTKETYLTLIRRTVPNGRIMAADFSDLMIESF
jgi:hypothetical protein